MLLYKIINSMPENHASKKVKSKPKIIRELIKADEEYRRLILLKEQQNNAPRSRSFNEV